MVSKKVVIESLSYKDGAEAVRWECDGSPEYSMGAGSRTTRGTDIILYIDDDSKEFLDQQRVDTLLRKYCRFLPVPVISGKEREWKDGAWTDTDRDLIINSTEPQWMKKPSELTDADYLAFYQELYPGQEEPLFGFTSMWTTPSTRQVSSISQKSKTTSTSTATAYSSTATRYSLPIR